METCIISAQTNQDISFEDYVEITALDYYWANMDGDPDQEMAKKWIHSEPIVEKLKQLYASGVDVEDVEKHLGWDGFDEFRAANSNQ